MTDPNALKISSSDLRGAPGELLAVNVERAEWEYTSLIVRRFAAGETWDYATGIDEVALVPLSGRCKVVAHDQEWEIGERPNLFTGPPSALYLPLESNFVVTALTPLELAMCGARAEQPHSPVLIRSEDIQIEIRGAGNAARQINHIIKPDFPAHRLLVVEVFTPSGNWSSFPPHKHDVSDMPREADLEEIYYYRIDPADGFGLQRLYTANGAIDAAYVIHDGDLLMVPEGYHAFAVAHGYTGYYLNVLAGNGHSRTMQPSDDPAYGWVRATWSDEMNEGARTWQDIDKRVNLGAGQRPET
jgi:5-deoxy-glucuronate isomerase